MEGESSKTARLRSAYISLGANRSSSCAVCDDNGTVAFGAGKFVALWDSGDASPRGVRATLPGHKGLVTTVKILRTAGKDTVLVSGDALGEVRIWDSQNSVEYRGSPFEAHPSSSISAIGVPPSSGPLANHLLTGASDGFIKVWKLSESGVEPELVQKLDLKGKLPLDIAVASLPGSEAPIVVVGCTDKRIQIFTSSSGELRHAISLEGHEDWVRCLSITTFPSAGESASTSTTPRDLVLATGSQDNYIRLWRIAASSIPSDSSSEKQSTNGGLDMLDEFERKLAGEAGGSGSVQISTKAHVLSVEDGQSSLRFTVTLEALLIGHEGGLTNVCWAPTPAGTSTPHLLSTASDNSLILWTPSNSATAHSADGIWIPAHRFGALGGRGLGFYGALWGKNGNSVMATGWNGGVEWWNKLADEGEGDERWEPVAGLSGHFGEVKSCTWDPRGDYLLSVGSDQTSRIHAPTKTPPDVSAVWAEIARPQIHGYDMTDATFLSPFRFASTADEKLTRVFDAPQGFVESLPLLGVTREDEEVDLASRPRGATVPPLGLSNRALGKVSDIPGAHVANSAVDSVSEVFTSRPTEEELATTTLWPEVEKIYGHGYELVTMASSHDGSLIATACRASNADHAVVRIHSTATWDAVGEPLRGHSLTITRITFSPDDKVILTVSRDRGWRLFQRTQAGGFEPLAKDERAHTRMILDTCWSPDGSLFVTASRDKTAKFWSKNANGEWTAVGMIKMTEGISAVDMTVIGEKEVLALGTESGRVELYDVERKDTSASVEIVKIGEAEPGASHVSAVNRLAWRTGASSNGDGPWQLASCSDDRSVRIFDVEF